MLLTHLKARLPGAGEAVSIAIPRLARTSTVAVLEATGQLLYRLPPARRRVLRRRDRIRTGEPGRWFTPEEEALVHALACVIIPSTEDVPGAADMDIIGTSAVRQIDALVAGRPGDHGRYARGLLAIDELAVRSYGGPYEALEASQQSALLSTVEALHRQLTDPSRSGLLRRLHQAASMLGAGGAAAELYPSLITDTQRVFYSSEVAWLWLEYDGPPMPLGYDSLDVPRPPRRVPVLGTAPATPRPDTGAWKDAADVVVVGSGAGGAVVAKELAEAGLSVIVLEAGPRYQPLRDYPTDRPDFESLGRDTFRAADDLRDVYTTPASSSFAYSRVKGVGGSTLHYVGMSPRLHESDFATRSRDGVGADWPITYQDLEPYYTRVEYELGVSGPDGANPFEPPRSRPYPTAAHPLNMASRTIKTGADRLGLHLVREPLAMPSADWRGRPACVGAGVCHMGCLISAKSSMDVTYIPKAEATGRVDLRTESMAREIETDASGRASAVVYIDADGRERRVTGRAIVVAGNAVETPRLLLMSRSRFPDGLANSSGLVGRNFMEHLAVYAFGLFEQRVDPWRGTPSGGIIQDAYETDARNDFARGWTTLVSANSHWPYTVASRVPGWGNEHKARVKQEFGHYITLATIGEQLPDERNRVVLDPLQKDVYGLPAPHLINTPRDNDRAMIRTMSARLRDLLEASGASRIWGNEHYSGMSSHYVGTCRMGTDPASSVVDPMGRAHDVPNLFLADSSVFVTAGASNPAITVSALALRISEGIVERFRSGTL